MGHLRPTSTTANLETKKGTWLSWQGGSKPLGRKAEGGVALRRRGSSHRRARSKVHVITTFFVFPTQCQRATHIQSDRFCPMAFGDVISWTWRGAWKGKVLHSVRWNGLFGQGWSWAAYKVACRNLFGRFGQLQMARIIHHNTRIGKDN